MQSMKPNSLYLVKAKDEYEIFLLKCGLKFRKKFSFGNYNYLQARQIFMGNMFWKTNDIYILLYENIQTEVQGILNERNTIKFNLIYFYILY